MLHDALGAGVQITATGVVAQSGPKVQHFVLFSLCQTEDIRKALHKSFKVGNYCGDLGLLQHNLRHPDPIWVDALLPRQVFAAVFVVPGKYHVAELELLTHLFFITAFYPPQYT